MEELLTKQIDIYEAMGIIGFLVIMYAATFKNRFYLHALSLIGNSALLTYSISIGSRVFIILQIVMNFIQLWMMYKYRRLWNEKH